MNKFKLKLLSLHKSFANWFNVFGLAYIEALVSFPELAQYLDARGLGYILLFGNVIIRVFKTTKAIEDK